MQSLLAIQILVSEIANAFANLVSMPVLTFHALFSSQGIADMRVGVVIFRLADSGSCARRGTSQSNCRMILFLNNPFTVAF